MQERNVVLTWEAIYDVTDIANYIEKEFGRERADRFERDIRQEIKDISFFGRHLWQYPYLLPCLLHF